MRVTALACLFVATAFGAGCGGNGDTANATSTGAGASTSTSTSPSSSGATSASTGTSASSGASTGSGGSDAGPPLPKSVTFPKGFFWAAATAGFQVEKGLDQSDWGQWAKTAGKIQNGDDPDNGPDAFAHVPGDVANLAAAGLNAYRFSIEMARLYPTRAAFDADMPDAQGISDYDAVLAALAEKQITPLVTLHHFVWPLWMDDPSMKSEPQGWERSDAGDVFETWCSRMGKRYGDRVDYWITINEPTVEASVGYLAGIWPPGVSDASRVVAVMKSQVKSHARCYDALKKADTIDADGDGAASNISIAKHNRVYEPQTPGDASDEAAAKHSDYFWNQWFLNALVYGDLDNDFDGKIGKGDLKGDASLKGRLDFLGLNYYGVSQVAGRGLSFPFVGAVPAQIGLSDGRPETDVGWSIDPQGFALVLDEAATYDLPILITENGIADQKDKNRSRFTLEHLLELGAAMQRGVKVIGYTHWALMDNFEWASGFCPRFGIYAVDESKADKPRSATKVVPILAALIQSGKLEQTTIDALPAYVSQPVTCASF